MSNIAENTVAKNDRGSISPNCRRLISLFGAALAGGNLVALALNVSNAPNAQTFFGKVGTPLIGAVGVCAGIFVAVVFSKAAARKTMEEAIPAVSEKKDATASVSNNPDAKPV